MRKTSLLGAAVASLALWAGSAGYAQSYSNAVQALNPVAYWPLTETAQPPAGQYLATNSGTLGAVGNGYYETWWQAASSSPVLFNTNNIQHVPGVTGDGDLAMQDGGVGQYVVFPRFTNGVANSALTITAPFTIELWAKTYTTNVGLAPMVTEGRNNIGGGNYAGLSLGQYQNKFYFTLYNTNGSTAQPEIDIAPMVSNKWYHIVVTFDGTTETIYSNGAQAQTKALTAKNGAGQYYVPDLVSPLLIGCGTQLGAANGGTPFPGILDEVAIYTNALTLTQIQNHYNATNSGYAAAVLVDNPTLYLRLNEPAFAGAPAPSTYPVANNYGNLGAAAQGVYQPGTMPGVPGPAYTGFGSASTAVALNGFNAGVDIGGGSLPAQLNPTGKQPVTVMTWFKGNPADCAGRFQALVGHGDLSWRLALDNNGGVRFNPGPGPELQFSSTQDLAANNIAPNDGNWHFAAGVSDGTNDFLYLDGVLVKAAANVGNIVGTNADLMLGGDIQYTAPQLSGGGGGRFFDGSIAHVAVFTNALSAAQIQQVYSAAGNIPPSIRVQPVGQTTFSGQSATLAATVAGASPISYQWYKNGSPVAGRTTAATQFTPASAGDAGSYFVVASNPYGSVTSAVVQLTVTGSASPYGATVQGLSPVAYWPLNENTQPPQPLNLSALNLGSLGTAGNGFYGAWYQPLGTSFYITNNIISSNGITFAADGSKGLACQRQPGQYVIIPRNTNGVANPAVTITPPFSIEVWAFVGSTNIGNMNLISQGQANQNSGGADNTNSWAGFALGQYQDYFYFSCFCTNGLSKSSELDTSGYNAHKGFNTNQWVHVVATFDGTTEQVYTNGVLANSKTVTANAAGLTYVPDPTSPLMIGGGNVGSGGGAAGAFSGVLDEVAIYPSVLSQQSVQIHYEAAYGTNAIYGNVYTNAVLADSPSLYYRFDDLQSRIGAGYPTSTFPVAANYGSLGTAANGVYQPGTTPGLPGPAFPGFASGASVGLNGFFGAVDIGGGSLPAALNPVGITPMSVIAWFKTAPADSPARFQNILGHSDSSYRLTFDNNSGSRFNPGPGPELQFANQTDLWTNGWTLNDGNWHMVAGISDGTNDLLYLDGLLVKTGTNTSGINIAGSGLDLMVGGDPAYTVPGATSANPRNFNGQIAQVAFWTNALTPAQVQQIYGAAGVPPTIVQQPLSFTNNAGTNVSLSVVAKGSSPTYQWYKNGSRLTGATATALTFNPLSLNDAGNYFVVVANSYGSVTSSVAQVTVYGPPVVQSQSPTDVKVFVGTAPVLHVAVTGPQPYSYQWSKNGSPIAGATASSYAPGTANVGSSSYACTVTNAYGSVSLSPITVAVLAAPTTSYPVAVLADHPMAYFRLDEAAAPGDWTGNGVTAYDYAGGLNATYTNSTLSQPGYTSQTTPQTDTDTAAGFGSASSMDSFAGNTPSYLSFATPTNGNSQFTVEAWVNGGWGQSTAAGILTLGYGNGGEQFNLDTGSGNSHNFRFFVRDAGGTARLANGTNGPSDNAWHHVVGVCDQANGQVLLYVDGVLTANGAIPASAGILNPTAPLSIGSRQSGKGTSYDSQFVGTIDEVAFYNYALSASQVATHYVAAGVAPRFVQQPPSAVTTNEGATVVISAAAMGTAPITYQWYKDGTLLTGQTSPTLTLRNVSIGDSGGYYVTANNTYASGPTYSQVAALTILSGPPILDVDLQPLWSTNYAGTPFTYSVSVSGTAPFTYQWYKNNSPISGATGSSYTFNTTQGTSYYYVTVANKQGSITSSTATNVGMAAVTLNPGDYTYKMKIAFPGYNRDETLADFPVLVKFGTNLPGFSYQQFASATGGDLRFTDASGTRQIPHEIDEWNPTGTSVVWVQVPHLAGTNDPSSTNNFIWAYWGNPAVTSPLAWSTNGGVWIPQAWEGLPGYQVVYHLKESALPFADSTLQAPATSGVAPAPVAGIVGTAGTFNGSAWLDAGTVKLGDALTLSAWVNVDSAASSQQTIWANQQGGYGAPGFALFVNTYQKADQLLDLASGGTGGNESTSGANTLGYGQWHLASVSINRTNGTAQFFVDGVGVAQSSSIVKDFANWADLNLGRLTNGGAYFHGTMDEARIRLTASSTNWTWAEYMTVAQNATFQNYAAISSSVVTITYQVVNGNLVLNWALGTLQVADQVNGSYTDVTTATSPYSVPLSATSKFYRIKVR